jgi:senataxin
VIIFQLIKFSLLFSGTAYGRSLFQRLQEGGVPVYMLTSQYRMHPRICLYPSQQFYGGALRNAGRTCSMQSIFGAEVGMSIRGCRFKLGHYCFMDVGWGTEREELIGHSRANYEEALVVCNVVEGVVKGLLPGLKPNVGVITPYIAQRGVIEDQLGRRGIDTTACEVNTVDGFQGREKDVIVLSCVRAMADRGLGFVSDEKRMNVALTRAKYSLIIVGHAQTLQKWSRAWGSLIDDARNRGCYQVLTNHNKNQNIPPMYAASLNQGFFFFIST